MSQKNKYLICVLGPTASGKTGLAIDLAKHFKTEILNFDSRQFYKEMFIGTAKPTPEELSQAPHHFIDNKSILEDYNAGQYEIEANDLLDKLFLQKDIVITVGGSGLYLRALLEGFDEMPKIDPSIRESLTKLYQEKGLEVIQNKLFELDPKTHSTIDIHNHARIIRALEICISSGKPASEQRKSVKKERNYIPILIGIDWDREQLYNRINLRVDLMEKAGLLEEVKKLVEYQDQNALKTVGYSELFDALNRKHSVEEGYELIKRNTRRYAKKQLTWFRNQLDAKWFAPKDLDKIVQYVEDQCK